jgi:Sulfotransferase family
MSARRSIETLLGTPEAHRLRHRERKVARRPMPEVIAAVNARCEDRTEIPADEPLFLLSAGWRSGSTLVQRLVNSQATCFLWGEPYSRADLVPRLADSIRPVTDAWPRHADVLHENDGAVADRWTANLHPGLETLLASHRALLRTLFAPPAGAPADSCWGFKEVRLSADHALYLHLLFPRARFVFLVRDPLDAFASYKSWRSWYLRWPDDQVRTAWAYGGLWADLADGFLGAIATVDGIVIRYEDLVPGGAAIAALEDLLGARVDEKALAHRISGHDGGPDRLSGLERRVIARRTGSVARRLGYAAPDSPGDRRVAFAGDRQRPS